MKDKLKGLIRYSKLSLYVSNKDMGREASKIERMAQTSGLVTGPTTGGTVWCPKTKEPIEEYLCWHTCVDGKKVGEKVVCGKRGGTPRPDWDAEPHPLVFDGSQFPAGARIN